MVDADAAARSWIDGWSRAWPAKDADAVAGLYAEDGVYSSHPFRERESSPRAYALQAFADEELVEVRFGEPVVGGNRAAVEYWAVLLSEGRKVTIAGTAVLRFAPDGRVEEHRDYWALQVGRREPPAGWGA